MNVLSPNYVKSILKFEYKDYQDISAKRSNLFELP